MENKTCIRCGIARPRAEFYACRNTDGLYNTCKICEREKGRAAHTRPHARSKEEYFTRYVSETNPAICWPWQGKPNNKGYGNASFGGPYIGAHRFSWGLFYGEIPLGLYVCHTCDNRLCVNPTHLFLGTHAENIADMVAKGRASRLRRYHKLSPENVVQIRADLAAGARQTEIAQRFDVHQGTISAISRRKTWASAEREASTSYLVATGVLAEPR